MTTGATLPRPRPRGATPPRPVPPRLPAGGWRVLRDCPLGGGPPVPLALLHPAFGVALVEPPRPPGEDAATRLRARLAAARFGAVFPGHLPVVLLREAPGETPGALEAAFARHRPPALPGGDAWMAAVERALTAAPPPAALPARRGATWRWPALLALAAGLGLALAAMPPWRERPPPPAGSGGAAPEAARTGGAVTPGASDSAAAAPTAPPGAQPLPTSPPPAAAPPPPSAATSPPVAASPPPLAATPPPPPASLPPIAAPPRAGPLPRAEPVPRPPPPAAAVLPPIAAPPRTGGPASPPPHPEPAPPPPYGLPPIAAPPPHWPGAAAVPRRPHPPPECHEILARLRAGAVPAEPELAFFDRYCRF